MFLAALKSLSITQPHLQTCLLVDSVFFTIAPLLEHSWLVYCGFTATVTFSNTLANYSIETRNWYQDASLIDLVRQGFFTIFLILKSTEALKSLDAHYAPCKFYCMMQYDCLLILRWRHPRICLAFPLFFEPLILLDTIPWERLRTFSPWRKNLEFSIVTRFESV